MPSVQATTRNDGVRSSAAALADCWLDTVKPRSSRRSVSTSCLAQTSTVPPMDSPGRPAATAERASSSASASHSSGQVRTPGTRPTRSRVSCLETSKVATPISSRPAPSVSPAWSPAARTTVAETTGEGSKCLPSTSASSQPASPPSAIGSTASATARTPSRAPMPWAASTMNSLRRRRTM